MVDYALEFIFEGDVEDAWGEYHDGESHEDEEYDSLSETKVTVRDSLVKSREKSDRELIVQRARYESYRTRFRKEREREGAIREEEKREKLRKFMGMKLRKDGDGESIKTELSFEAKDEKKAEVESSSEDSSHLCLKAIDVSDSQLRLSDDSEILGTEETLRRVPVYKDEGTQRFFDVVRQMELRPISSMKEMLQSDAINLRYYGIDPRIVRAIAEAVEKNTSVQIIDLTDNWLSVDACHYLGQLLQTNDILTNLVLSGCRIGPEGAKKLQDGIAAASALTSIDLSRCDIGDTGIEYIASAIRQNGAIENVNLMKNKLREKGAQCLGEMLKETESLKRLDLSWNHLWQGAFAETFFEGLSKNLNLEYLNLSGNCLGEDNTPFLSSYLANSTSLRELDLSSNNFAESDAIQLATALLTNSGLEILRLGNNPLQASGTLALVDVLAPKKSPNLQLKLLDLENVWADKDIIPALDIVKRERLSLEIILGGIAGNYKLLGPDLKKMFLRRADYEAMNTKKKKHRRNFGHFVLSLEDTAVAPEIFKESVKKFKLKLSESLLDELAKAFDTGEGEVDVMSLKKLYMQEHPETQTPSPKSGERRKKSVKIKSHPLK